MGEDDTCDQKSVTAGCIPCGLFVLFLGSQKAAVDFRARLGFRAGSR
jgi:hypothetical protein